MEKVLEVPLLIPFQKPLGRFRGSKRRVRAAGGHLGHHSCLPVGLVVCRYFNAPDVHSVQTSCRRLGSPEVDRGENWYEGEFY